MAVPARGTHHTTHRQLRCCRCGPEPMSHLSSRHLPAVPPPVTVPPPFVERRTGSRRQTDIDRDNEIAFLARALDAVAGSGSAEERLAALLDVIARAAGAQRAAVLAERGTRLILAPVRPGEDTEAAEELAAWLDANSPRTRAERAAAGPASVSLAMGADAVANSWESDKPLEARSAAAPAEGEAVDRNAITPFRAVDGRHAWVAVPGGSVILGFAFADGAASEGWDVRFPAAIARDAEAALALVSDVLTAEKELAGLRARDTERNRFVTTVAHEMRTPLTGLAGYLELILAGGINDAAVEHEFLTRSRDIVSTMEDLVGDLLELSRLELGTLRVEAELVSLAEAGQRVVAHLAPIALEREIALSASLPPRLRVATGDRRRVEQILKNVVGNALKFTPSGGHVELAAWFDGPVAIIAVRDDGAGISPEDRGLVFKRFFRMASHEQVTGTGLGLPIARELAQMMGGGIDVASVVGAGSTFVLALPGPRPVDASKVAAALARALAVEEVRLEAGDRSTGDAPVPTRSSLSQRRS